MSFLEYSIFQNNLVVLFKDKLGFTTINKPLSIPSTKSLSSQSEKGFSIQEPTCSVQKYLMTLGCWSLSRSRSTSRSAMEKQSGSTRFTATARPSKLPLNMPSPVLTLSKWLKCITIHINYKSSCKGFRSLKSFRIMNL